MSKPALYSVVLPCLGASPALSLANKPYLLETDADFANLPRAAPSRRLAGGRDMQIVLDLQRTPLAM